MDEGWIDVRRAREFDRQTTHLPTDEARDLVDRVITDATDLTTGQLRARLQRLCLEVDPQAAKTRYEKALVKTASLLGLNLTPNKTGAAFTKINDLAQRLKRKGDPRTMDQTRADVFLDLLLGGHRAKTSRKGVVDIRVDLKTLTELTETPGELAGYGPVIADIARQIALDQPNAEFRFAVTSDDGQIVHVGTSPRRHHQTAAHLFDETAGAGPTSNLCVPRLSDAGNRLRQRPPRSGSRGWSHDSMQPHTTMPTPPPG